jgi:hypothetical protein
MSKVVRWRASYAGDATNDVASSETSLPSYSTIPDIEIRTNRPVHTYGGARFRLRYDVAGNEEYAAARAPWVNLRFTR